VCVTSGNKTVVCPGEAISKSQKDYQTLLRRAESVGYERCLAMLDKEQKSSDNNTTTDEGASHE